MAHSMATCKSFEWKSDLQRRIKTYLDSFVDYLLQREQHAIFISTLNELYQSQSSVIRFEICLHFGRFYYEQSEREAVKGNFRLSSQFAHECPFYLEEASKLSRDLSEYIEENYAFQNILESLRESFGTQIILVEAKKNKREADEMYMRTILMAPKKHRNLKEKNKAKAVKAYSF